MKDQRGPPQKDRGTTNRRPETPTKKKKGKNPGGNKKRYKMIFLATSLLLAGASVAAGAAEGGFDSMEQALELLPPAERRIIEPSSSGQGREHYAELYASWRDLHGRFGKDFPGLMHGLRDLKRRARPTEPRHDEGS